MTNMGHPKMIAAIEQRVGEQWEDRMLHATDNATAGTKAVGPNKAMDDASFRDRLNGREQIKTRAKANA